MTSKNGVDQKLIRELATILDETHLTEIEVEQGEMRIRVARQTFSGVATATQAAPAPAAASSTSAVDPRASDGTEPAAEISKNAVPAPMVGTAYRSSSPGASPYVEVGQSVYEGQTLLIIEAMKTMNQIPSPRAGTVTAIFFEDAQPVEYGEPLVVVE